MSLFYALYLWHVFILHIIFMVCLYSTPYIYGTSLFYALYLWHVFILHIFMVCLYSTPYIYGMSLFYALYLWYVFILHLIFMVSVSILHIIFVVCLYSTHYIPSLNGSLRLRKLKRQNYARPSRSFAFYYKPALNKNLIFLLRF
jgi:hypothetical protein